MKFKYWLQLFRAQTAPATVLLILVPYLTDASLFSLEALVVGLFALLAHWVSFGHNSLMDTAMGYDRRDPSKSHHPLVAGRISMAAAHNVIHWSLSGLAVVAILISLALSSNPTLAIISIFLWFVFGYAYNSGLSKECLLSFLPISTCFTAMGAWGWFLSHSALDRLGWLLLAYFFMTILFQISWSGHLKELELKEGSNILVKMGAKVWRGKFTPGYSMVYGGVVKFINVPILGGFLLLESFDWSRFLWLILMVGSTAYVLFKLITPREYKREKELQKMSVMEIVTIFTPLPLVLPWLEATLLMLFGVAYFVLMNKALWGVEYPRV
jgi:4-hydroxybenzoate polyprenyltransferase